MAEAQSAFDPPETADELWGSPQPERGFVDQSLRSIGSGALDFGARVNDAGAGISQAVGAFDQRDKFLKSAEDKYQQAQELSAPTDITESEGVLDFAKRSWNAFLQSSPQLATTLGAAGTAAAMTPPVLPFVGPLAKPIAAVVGGAAVNIPGFIGANIREQLNVGRKPEDLEVGKAAAMAVPQAGLDALISVLLPGVGKQVAGGVVSRATRGLLEGALIGATTETLQEAGQIFQANPELLKEFGPDVQKRLINAGVLGAVIEGPIGAGSRVADGSSKKPVKVENIEDLKAARDRVERPTTENQKLTGRYKKGFINLDGLDIAIETPAGGLREGRSNDGVDWSVELPFDYGEIKRTEGADGDPVDVYIGPQVKSDKVWVIDQQDPKTGKFDEHKAMLGFAGRDAAIAAYDASFSDGSGMSRIKNIREMPIETFKAWSKEGDTTVEASAAVLPITVQDVHKLAEQKGIEWDSNLDFMEATERLTGKRHLDELKQPQLRKMFDALNAVPANASPKYMAATRDYDADLTNSALEYYGTTNDPREAGYILPDGRFLDLSGRKLGAGEDNAGRRVIDHRDLPEEIGAGSATENMEKFMDRTGAVRVDFKFGTVQARGNPTKAQLRAAADAANMLGVDVTVDAVDENGKHRSVKVRDPSLSKLQRFFNDPNAPEEMFSYQQSDEPFYSALGKFVEETQQSKAPADQWLGMLRRQPGLRKEELEWSGIEDWLSEQKGSVSREDLAQKVAENSIKLEETLLDGKPKTPVTQNVEVRPVAPPEMDDYAIVPGASFYGWNHGPETWQVFEQGDLSGSYWVAQDTGGMDQPITGASREGVLATLRDNLAATVMDNTEQYGGVAPTVNAPRWSRYQVPGGENYRELLIKLPPTKNLVGGWKVVMSPDGRSAGEYDTEEAALNAARGVNGTVEKVAPMVAEGGFRSGHFSDVNILAHLRMNDRTDADGNKVLFLEEIQSDWHQKGRDHGYKTPDRVAAAKRAKDELDKAIYKKSVLLSEKLKSITGHDSYTNLLGDPFLSKEQKSLLKDKVSEAAKADPLIEAATKEIHAAQNELDKNKILSSAPDGPFKKSWHELAFKRALREAVEGGYDKLAWTNGDQQLERYPLESVTRNISARRRGDQILVRTGNVELDRRIQLGGYGEGYQNGGGGTLMTDAQVQEVFGKDLGGKIIDGVVGTSGETSDFQLSGVDVRMGGEGMRGFYDDVIPRYAKKLAKKYGSQVGRTSLDYGDSRPDRSYVVTDDYDGVRHYVNQVVDGEVGPEVSGPFDSIQDAESEMETLNNEMDMKLFGSVHSIDITPSLKEAVMAGQPLFSAPRGPEKRDLVAIHNLTADDLGRVEELGGMPAPSIAITRDGMPHSGFGEISLIGNQEMIDPEVSGRNRVFSSDAWTTRPPQKEYDVDRKAAGRLWNMVRDYRDTGDYFGDLDNEISKGPDSLSYQLNKSNSLRIAFLRDNGIDFVVPTKPKNLFLPWSDMKALKEYYRAHSPSDGDYYNDPKFHEAFKNAMKEATNNMARDRGVSVQDLAAIRSSWEETWLNDDGKVPYGYAHRAEDDAKRVRGREREVDKTLADKRLSRLVKKVGQDKYNSFIEELVGGIYYNPHFKMSRRKMPYSLDNVMEFIDAQTMRGAEKGIFHGLGSARAKGTKRFKSVDAIRRNKDMIQGPEAEKIHKELSDRFLGIQEKLSRYYRYPESSGFNKLDDASRALAEIGKKPRLDPKYALSRFDYTNVPDYLAEEFGDFAKDFHNAPVEYFEAKQIRALQLNEFQGAVVPRGTPQETIDRLKQNGITDIRYYTRGDDASRARAVSKFKQHMFAPGVKYQPQYQEMRTALAEDITKIVGRITDGKAKLKTPDVIYGEGARLAESGGGRDRRRVAGRFSPIDSLVEVSLSPEFDGRKAAAHEAFHWIKQNGIFSEREQKALLNNVDKLKTMVKAEGLDPSSMSPEEIEAVAFGRWWRIKENTGETGGVPPGVKGVFYKLAEFFRLLRDRLRQQGFAGLKDAFKLDEEAVFNRAASGQMARRNQNIQRVKPSTVPVGRRSLAGAVGQPGASQ